MRASSQIEKNALANSGSATSPIGRSLWKKRAPRPGSCTPVRRSSLATSGNRRRIASSQRPRRAASPKPIRSISSMLRSAIAAPFSEVA